MANGVKGVSGSGTIARLVVTIGLFLTVSVAVAGIAFFIIILTCYSTLWQFGDSPLLSYLISLFFGLGWGAFIARMFWTESRAKGMTLDFWLAAVAVSLMAGGIIGFGLTFWG